MTTCPQCGALVATSTDKCHRCGKDVQHVAEPAEPAERESFIDRLSDYWWGRLLLGTFALWCAYDAYSLFTRLENPPPVAINQPEEAIWMNKHIIMTYRWGGKWAIVGPLALLGMILVVAGIWPLVSGKPKVSTTDRKPDALT